MSRLGIGGGKPNGCTGPCGHESKSNKTKDFSGRREWYSQPPQTFHSWPKIPLEADDAAGDGPSIPKSKPFFLREPLRGTRQERTRRKAPIRTLSARSNVAHPPTRSGRIDVYDHPKASSVHLHDSSFHGQPMPEARRKVNTHTGSFAGE